MRYALLILLCAGCSSRLPDLPPEAFACVDDSPAEDGELQCPDTHHCDDQACRPRLDCVEPGSATPGCTESVKRCDLTHNSQIAAVSCESGLYTLTTTVPRGGCSCPGDLLCAQLVAEPGRKPDELKLFLSAPDRTTTTLPPDLIEDPVGRLCVMPCGTEADCPANHTCRPAILLRAASNLPADGRHTIGACYPQMLVTTTTVADQADPLACSTEGDCSVEAGREDGLCRVDVVIVPDHPIRPAGAVWGEHLALIPRCREDNLSGLSRDGNGCTDSNDCQSGVCHSQRCARLCNPGDPEICAFGGDCVDTIVTRTVPSGVTILDRLFICGS